MIVVFVSFLGDGNFLKIQIIEWLQILLFIQMFICSFGVWDGALLAQQANQEAEAYLSSM